ncbi:MAG TPA: winged helix-turn-helix domain-containing protein [Blastocatellia bacterium]
MSTAASNPLYEFGPFRLDKKERVLLRQGEVVPLTPKAFDTLLVLVEHRGHVVGKDELMSLVWPDSFVEETNLAQNISLIRKALLEAGQYIETVPKRGYRFNPGVVKTQSASTNAPDQTLVHAPAQAATDSADASAVAVVQPSSTDGTDRGAPPDHSLSTTAPAALVLPDTPDVSTGPYATSGRSRLFKVALTTAVVIALAIAIIYVLRSRSYSAAARSGTRTLAVLPFQDLKQDPDTEFLGFSLADSIISRLDYVGSLIVRPSSYIGKYRNHEVDAKQAASELSVDTLLTGNYIKDGDDLRITAQLIDVNSNRILWHDTINVKYEKLLTVQDEVTEQIIKGLELNLAPAEAARLHRDVPADPRAYEYYLRGIDLFDAGDFPNSVKLLESAVELDPNYAMSWTQLGASLTSRAAFGFGGRDDYARAQAAYEKALKLNPDQIEARVYLANLYTDTNRVEQAVGMLKDAIKTSPNNALAHWELSYSYRFGGLLDESVQQAELARRLDPKVKINSSAVNAYLYKGDYDQFLKKLPEGDDSSFVSFYRGYGEYYLKDNARAEQDFNRAYDRDKTLFTQIGKALSYGIAGQAQAGRDLLADTERKAEQTGVGDPEALYKIAQAYAVLGDQPSSLRVLGRAIDGGFFCYPYMVRDPLMAGIRGLDTALMDKDRARFEQFRKSFANN